MDIWGAATIEIKDRELNTFLLIAKLQILAIISGVILGLVEPITIAELTDIHGDIELTTTSILVNNLTVLISILFLGILTFGFASVLIFSFNIFMVAYSITSLSSKVSLSFLAVAILPHGITEVLGLLIATTVSINIPFLMYKRFRYKSSVNYYIFIKVIFISILLIVFSAFIEAEITSRLTRLLFEVP